MWDGSWRQHRVLFHSDSMAVVEVIRRKTAKHPLLLHLLCCVYLYAACFQFSYSTHHLPGVNNVAADSLSRNNMWLFNSLVTQASCTEVEQEVVDLLISRRPNWESQDWITLFRAAL